LEGVALGGAALGGVALGGVALGGVSLEGAALGGVALGGAALGGTALERGVPKPSVAAANTLTRRTHAPKADAIAPETRCEDFVRRDNVIFRVVESTHWVLWRQSRVSGDKKASEKHSPAGFSKVRDRRSQRTRHG
jgi:hypothetical protein